MDSLVFGMPIPCLLDSPYLGKETWLNAVNANQKEAWDDELFIEYILPILLKYSVCMLEFASLLDHRMNSSELDQITLS